MVKLDDIQFEICNDVLKTVKYWASHGVAPGQIELDEVEINSDSVDYMEIFLACCRCAFRVYEIDLKGDTLIEIRHRYYNDVNGLGRVYLDSVTNRRTKKKPVKKAVGKK